MTPSEFKAWFDGFTEAIEDQPSKKQWARIKERVSQIDGTPITERIYVDRYWPYPRPWPYYPYYGTSGGCGNAPIWYGASGTTSISTGQAATVGGTNGTFNVSCNAQSPDSYKPAFDSHTAMYALGKADAGQLSQ